MSTSKPCRFVALLGLMLATGCANAWEPKARTTPLSAEATISNTAGLTHMVVRAPGSKLRTCTQPFPDAAFDQGEAARFDISLVSVGKDESASESENSAEVEMAGRTPAVLMAREFFYRTCEFSQNYKLEKEEARELYEKTLDAVTQVWATEAGNTTVTVGENVNTTTSTLTTDTESNIIGAAPRSDSTKKKSPDPPDDYNN